MSEKYNRAPRSSSGTQICCKITDNSASGEAEAALSDAAEEVVQAQKRRCSDFSDPVCINTSQIYDSCRDRDCITDGKVYLTSEGQALLDNAINVKLKRAEIIWVYTNVEPLSFNKGYFSVDLKFFIRTTLEIFTGICNPAVVYGLTTFDKKVILFGSEGSTKIFKSDFNFGSCDPSTLWQSTCLPTVVVETVEPVALNAKIVDSGCCCCCCDNCEDEGTDNPIIGCAECGLFPEAICNCFDGDLIIDDCGKQIFVSYGLFSIIRLERDSQLLIDAVDFCIPTQECPSATENSPCDLFNDIRFPIDEFFPPQKSSEERSGCHNKNNGCCGCGN